MDPLQLIAALVEHLSWPLAAVILVLMLRKPLGVLLPTLRHLQYNGLEATFGDELKRTEEQARELQVDFQPPRQLQPPKAPAPAPQDRLQEADRLLEDFPEPAVAVAWQAIEDQLAAAVMSSGGTHSTSQADENYLLVNGKIDRPTMALLSRMKNLRNMAVHGGLGSTGVAVDEAREFLALTRGVVAKLKA